MDDGTFVSEEAAFDNFIFGFQRKLFGFPVPEVLDEVEHVSGKHLAGVTRDFAFDGVPADDPNSPIGDDFLIGNSSFDVASAFCREIDDDAAGRIPEIISR